MVGVSALVQGCDGLQSALMPAGTDAGHVADLFWWMLGGATVIWLAVVVIGLSATQIKRSVIGVRGARLLIIGGGVVIPLVTLTALLAYGLSLQARLSEAPPPNALRIAVSGEQWWWRVRYLPAGGEAVTTANEIRLPVGEPVEFLLTSPDVIHSFWIPPLGGKVDMIPGRKNRLVLRPTRTGTYRGACAEYCGASHARMNFMVVVMERQAYADWLAAQARPARPPVDPVAARGRELFLANGCGACHAIRGTPAKGAVGPDLTHVGGRLTIGAGMLPTNIANFEQWISDTGRLKPKVHMPAFGMLPPDEITAVATYLNGLK